MYTIFSIDFAIALSYMAGFIALVSSTQVRLCHGMICALVRVDTVFAALNYFVWTASSVRSGCSISEFTHKLKRIEDFSEKAIA